MSCQLTVTGKSFLFTAHNMTCSSLTRSPSPPPQYDNSGKRVNTKEYRYRKRLEDERHKLVEKALKTIPDYKPPSDYRRPTKTQEKVYVPVNDYPEINFSMIHIPTHLLTSFSSRFLDKWCIPPYPVDSALCTADKVPLLICPTASCNCF